MLERIVFLLAVFLGVIYGARLLERTWPIAATPQSEVRDDWLAVIVSLVVTHSLSPVTSICSSAILSWTGIGWVMLPTQGYWYWISLVIIVVALDLYKYAFHRLQHAIPFLWEMHSFHHSANALTFITGARHLWMERVMTAAFLPIITIILQMPLDMALIVNMIFFLPDTCAHLNVRVPMGRAITWICGPQWHRIHHSVHSEHYDKNFASILPLWDFVFGTAWVPKPDEYPDTGFDPPVQVDMIDSIIWPFRHLRRRKAAA